MKHFRAIIYWNGRVSVTCNGRSIGQGFVRSIDASAEMIGKDDGAEISVSGGRFKCWTSKAKAGDHVKLEVTISREFTRTWILRLGQATEVLVGPKG